MEKIIDCRYCEYATCESANGNWCDCNVEDEAYFDHHVTDFKESEQCSWFRYCDIFPKY